MILLCLKLFIVSFTVQSSLKSAYGCKDEVLWIYVFSFHWKNENRMTNIKNTTMADNKAHMHPMYHADLSSTPVCVLTTKVSFEVNRKSWRKWKTEKIRKNFFTSFFSHTHIWAVQIIHYALGGGRGPGAIKCHVNFLF